MAETLVFLFLGIAFAAFSHPFTRTGWEMIVGVIVIVMIARAVNVAVVTYWSNSLRDKVREPKILNKKGFQFILWVSGL